MKKYSICIFLCGALLAGCSSEKGLSQIEIPEEKIAKFQMGSIRSKAEEYKHLSDFIEDMEEAVPEKKQKKAPHRGEDYYPVSFIYEDETKDIFYFFPKGEKWYLETENGDVYGNADFILDYVDIDFNADVKMEIRIDKDTFKRYLEIGKDFKTYDMNFSFAIGVVNTMERTGGTEEEAISEARKGFIDSQKVYEYAKKSGYEVTEKEVEERIKKILEDFNEQEDYPEYEAICKEYGTTMEECLEKSRDEIKEKMTRDKLSLEIYKEFQNGKDKIKDKTYETPYEYSRAFLDEIVYTEISDEDIASYIQELDEAEAYYLENF